MEKTKRVEKKKQINLEITNDKLVVMGSSINKDISFDTILKNYLNIKM
jgi:hypothetical protein